MPQDTTLRLPSRPGADTGSTPAAAVPRVTLKASPKIRNVYHCAFAEAALPPEVSKRRPVIVVSYKNSLRGPVLVVPLTTRAQGQDLWAVRLARNPTPGEACEVWVVCNHLYTVSCARLSATHGVVPRLTGAEFLPIHELILRWLPSLQPGGESC